MPTVFVEDGFRFFFYSNDHVPIHVHVRKGQAEAVFNVEQDVELREAVGLQGGGTPPSRGVGNSTSGAYNFQVA